jgi:hypothetical protein
MSDANYLPQGEDIFSCTKCKMHFILPSCCDHYQQNKIQELESENDRLKNHDIIGYEAVIQELEASKKEALALIEFYSDEINYPEHYSEVYDSGKLAREFLKKHEGEK